MKFGFTGCRKGMTLDQHRAFSQLVSALKEYIDEFHHGDCIGSDIEAHRIVMWAAPKAKIVIHPPDNGALRAFAKEGEILPPKPYLYRNKDIVDVTDVMFVVPEQRKEIRRSGTWSTYRYAKATKKPAIVFYPR